LRSSGFSNKENKRNNTVSNDMSALKVDKITLLNAMKDTFGNSVGGWAETPGRKDINQKIKMIHK